MQNYNEMAMPASSAYLVSHSITSNTFYMWAGRHLSASSGFTARGRIDTAWNCAGKCFKYVINLCISQELWLNSFYFTNKVFVHVPIQSLDIKSQEWALCNWAALLDLTWCKEEERSVVLYQLKEHTDSSKSSILVKKSRPWVGMEPRKWQIITVLCWCQCVTFNLECHHIHICVFFSYPHWKKSKGYKIIRS